MTVCTQKGMLCVCVCEGHKSSVHGCNSVLCIGGYVCVCVRERESEEEYVSVCSYM